MAKYQTIPCHKYRVIVERIDNDAKTSSTVFAPNADQAIALVRGLRGLESLYRVFQVHILCDIGVWVQIYLDEYGVTA